MIRKLVLLLVVVAAKVSYPSCGGPEDPLNLNLTGVDSLKLKDHVDSLRLNALHLSVIQLDSFYCLNSSFAYPVWQCKARFRNVQLIKGSPVSRESEFELFDMEGTLFQALSERYVVAHDSMIGLTEIPVRGACYSPYGGTFISGDLIYNKGISLGTYLPSTYLTGRQFDTTQAAIVIRYWKSKYTAYYLDHRKFEISHPSSIPGHIRLKLESSDASAVVRLTKTQFSQMDFSDARLVGYYESQRPSSVGSKAETEIAKGKEKYNVLGRQLELLVPFRMGNFRR